MNYEVETNMTKDELIEDLQSCGFSPDGIEAVLKYLDPDGKREDFADAYSDHFFSEHENAKQAVTNICGRVQNDTVDDLRFEVRRKQCEQGLYDEESIETELEAACIGYLENNMNVKVLKFDDGVVVVEKLVMSPK